MTPRRKPVRGQPKVDWARLHAARAQGYVCDALTYLPSPLVAENRFLTMTPDRGPVPSLASARRHLPEPFWGRAPERAYG